MSLKNQILEFLKGRDWVNGGEIERFAMNKGYKASNASRRCRELRELDILEDNNPVKAKQSVAYRLNSTTPTPESPEINTNEASQPPMFKVRYPRQFQ